MSQDRYTTRVSSSYGIRGPLYDRAAAAALEPLERAGQRALNKARVHEVRCPAQPNNHRLAEVFKTRSGLVIRGRGPFRHIDVERSGGELQAPDGHWVPWDAETTRTTVRHRDSLLCCFLTARTPVGPPGSLRARAGVEEPTVYEVECRCRTADLYGIALIEAIKSGIRKSIYSGERPSVAL